MNYKKYLTLIILTVCISNTYGQTNEEKRTLIHNNETKLKEIADSCRRLENKNYERTLSASKNNVWPLEVKTNGQVGHLFRINILGQPEYIYQLDLGGIKTINAQQLYTGGSLGLNYTGQGFMLGIWESFTQTFSNGKYNRHYYPLTSHQDFQVGSLSRVSIGPEDPGEQNLMNIFNYSLSGHATVVCGISGSDSNSNNGNTRGVASGLSMRAFTDYYVLSELAQMCSYPNNLLVSNHSYGTPLNPNYYDNYWLNNLLHAAPYHLAVFSEGNYWLSKYAATKNAISVGSVFEVLNYQGPQSVIAPNYFIHKGTPDYRVKPELVAKSQNVGGAHSNHNADYIYNIGGSSFSAPAVSASAILLQEMYKDYTNSFMLSTTLKGLMIHTARESGPIGPDAVFGFGLLDLEAAAKHIQQSGINTTIQESYLIEGYKREFNVFATDSIIKATLVWNDPACSNCTGPGTQLVNDLDIKIIGSNGLHLPWGLDSTNPTGPAVRLNNTRDNVEHITINNTTPGEIYKIVISHKGSFPLFEDTQIYSLLLSGTESCSSIAMNKLVKTNNIASNSHEIEYAKNQLEAKNNIEALATVDYSSGQEVLLTNGFTANKKSFFLGHIMDCNNNTLPNTAIQNNLRHTILFENDIKPNQTINLSFTIYPNPTTGHFKIGFEKEISGKYIIRNVLGAIVLEGQFESQKQLNLNTNMTMSPGTYNIEVATDTRKQFTKKLMIY